MVIKANEERVFINLDELDAIWSDDYRRDHYNVGVGAQSFEVSREVADAIFAALEKREGELDHIREMSETVGQWIGRATKAEGDVVELRRVLYAVLKQWSDDTAGNPENKALWQDARYVLETTPTGSPNKQVTS